MKRKTAGNCWQRPSSFESLLASGQETWPFTWLPFKDRLQHGGHLLAIGALLARSNQLSLAQGMTVNLFIRSAQMRFFVPKQETECLARIFHQHVNVFAIPSR